MTTSTQANATPIDDAFVARALALAEGGLYTASPNPRVGCVIVRDGEVIGEGWHQQAGGPHAEVVALADAHARGRDTRGATAYVSLEPCNHHGRTPPCTDALLAAGITRVVAATRDPNTVAGGGVERLRAAGVAVDCGVLEGEARELNIGWIKRITTGRPWVRMKIAASLDGRTALANGTSRWITGDAARADGHRWRARADAILTGIGTVKQDNPRLTVRAIEVPRQPLKVVVDRNSELAPTARLLSEGHVLAVTATAGNPAWPPNVQTLALPDGNGKIDLDAMMVALGQRGINEVHVEAGAKLNGALLGAGLVDELLLYYAPCVLGDSALGMFALSGSLNEPLIKLDQRPSLTIRRIDTIGDDIRIIARVISPSAPQAPREVR